MPIRRSIPMIVLIAASLTSACHGGIEPTVPASGPTWHQDVRPIVEARCANCHIAGGIGPFDLSSYAEIKKVGPLVAASTASRAMPPWHASKEQAYHANPALTDTQIALIGDWVKAGMLKGDPKTPGAALSGSTSKLSRVDVTLTVPEPYVPQKKPDDYRCFLLDWPKDKAGYVTGLDVVPGQIGIVHHVAAFLLTPDALMADSALKTLTERDKKEAGPGYTCFGGPTGASDLVVPIQQIGQWVPGQQGSDFPVGTGIRVPPGSKVILQMHYNMDFVAATADQTVLKFRFDDEVERKAAFAPWLNPQWVMGDMKIPAGEASVSHTMKGDPRGFWKNFIGDVDVSQGFVIWGGLLHLHTLGASAKVHVLRADGSEEVILNTPKYDFFWQRLYMLAKPITFHPGDELVVRCTWDNSEANQPLIDGKRKQVDEVNWGEGSMEEMCVANLFISEL